MQLHKFFDTTNWHSSRLSYENMIVRQSRILQTFWWNSYQNQMALKIFKDTFVFLTKILTRELMNSAHKISWPKGKYVKNINKVRWDKNDSSWYRSLTSYFLFSKHKALNIFVQWNQMLHFWVLRTASTSVCPNRSASPAGVKPHLQVKMYFNIYFFHEFQKGTIHLRHQHVLGGGGVSPCTDGQNVRVHKDQKFPS